MFKNYLKTALRTITRNKVYSAINVIGLSIGLCTCLIVGTIVVNDLSYDRQWSKGDDIYRILTVNKMGEGMYDKFPASFVGLNSVLKNDYPEVENTSTISHNKIRLKLNEDVPNGVEIKTLQADTSVWQLLDFKVLEGTPQRFIAGQKNLVITESFRKKYFPKENPVGKIVYDVPTYQAKPTPFLISGVIKDLPTNTVFRSEALILTPPFTEALNKQGWGTFTTSYVLFKRGTDIAKFSHKLNKWYAGFVDSKKLYQYEFQPLKEIYLHSDFATGQEVKGDYKNIFILGGIALLVLLISCINFINLGTARAVFRLKETGVRKVLGARRGQLVGQYLAEAFIFFLIAMAIAFPLYGIAFHLVENFLGYPLGNNVLTTPIYLFSAVAGIIILSLAIGFYPAWLLSGFKPVATLKGKLFTGNQATQNFVRKGLVVLQFAISIFVLIALVVIQYQVNFMKKKDIGFQKENLLNVSFINWQGKGETFKNELKKIHGVEDAAISSYVPAGGGGGYMSREIDNPENPNEKLTVWYINGDAELAQTLGLKLKEGRFLNPALKTDAVPADSAQENMQNRSAILTNFTAKVLDVRQLNHRLANVQIVPVGIVDDFNNQSLKSAMQPTIITAEDSLNYGFMLVRILPGTDKEVVAGIHKLWKQFYPNNFLEIKWMEDVVAQQYQAEERLGKIFTFFSMLTMLIAALGIFGLVVQATAQRTKEIGIRKVLGASVSGIVRLFTYDFVKLIFLSLIIASPIAWWLMNKWLMDYAYRVKISWWIFVVAGVAAIMVAVVTIGFQAVKAARANPVKSLRTE